MKLTRHNKKLSFYEKERITEMKYKMIQESNYCCSVCGNKFNGANMPQIAHCINKGKQTYKKYGYEIINHRFNLRITCDKCNSSVMIDPESEEGKLLRESIEQDIINKA